MVLGPVVRASLTNTLEKGRICVAKRGTPSPKYTGHERAKDTYVGGNSNNDSYYGGFTVNLNNTASNGNWNNGACQSYLVKIKNL